jgi:hypothetical protein
VFPSRAAAGRVGLIALLREDREAQIGEAYRRAYAAVPDDERVGREGLRLGAALLTADDAPEGSPST